MALITGASSGIGAAFAWALAARQHDLVLVARRGDRLEALGQELAARHGVACRAIALDLTAPDAASTLAGQLEGTDVDVLVNNAGFGLTGAFGEQDEARIGQMIALNVGVLTALTRKLLPGMVARGRGGVVNVASTAAFQALPHMAVYGATKAYVLSFSEAIAEEVAPHGVKVVALCPGSTESEFAGQAGTGKYVAAMAAFKPLGAHLDADDVVREGLAALDAGRVIAVPGAFNRLNALATKLVSRRQARRMAGAFFH